jgi:outer membrane lipoprotein LolB
MRLRRSLLIGMLALLAGCATVEQIEPTSAGWTTHREQLAALQQWTASGKLALRTANSSDSASMVWQQQQQHSYLQLSGPLGMGATTLEMDGDQLTIRQGDEHTVLDISTPEAILDNTGWDLPLPALSYWLKGLPSPGSRAHSIELDPATELLRELQQDDWQVSFEKYGRFDGYILPIRLQITRGATKAKVIVSRWQVTASE